MMHFHGVPITPQAKLYEMAGRSFCVSYAAPDQVAICHEIGQSVLLDNGAYSFWTQNKPVDWNGYYEWAEPWLEYPTTWAIIPDVIDGTEEENDLLLAEWFQRRLPKGAPVWHLHESIDRLKRLCHGYERVCLGSSGQYAAIASYSWHARMEEAMDAVCGPGKSPWLHMLRGMGFAGDHYPFASVDSTNVARNHAGNNQGRPAKNPLAMALEWDRRQCPAPSHWKARNQLGLEAA